MAQLDKTFPTNDCSMCIMAPKLVEVGRNVNVELLMSSEVVALDGEPGNFIGHGQETAAEDPQREMYVVRPLRALLPPGSTGRLQRRAFAEKRRLHQLPPGHPLHILHRQGDTARASTAAPSTLTPGTTSASSRKEVSSTPSTSYGRSSLSRRRSAASATIPARTSA